MTNEEALKAGKLFATNCLSSMGYENAEWVGPACDGLSSEEVFDILLASTDDVIVVHGDWRTSKIDVYDVVLAFAEANFERIRHHKDSFGIYIVVMAEPLEDSSES
jgi:hypothetical protein